MARRTRAREILRLLEAGMPRGAIARAPSVSKHGVQPSRRRPPERGIGWAEAEAMATPRPTGRSSPRRSATATSTPDPDWERVHRELAREGVTLKRLHAEYRDALLERGEPSMSYDRFCKRYREFTVRKQVTSRVGHKAGRVTEVDWAGPTMALVDPGHGRGVEGPPVRRLPALQPPALRRADVGHEAGYLAALPRARLLLLRRLHALRRARQPQGRRQAPPQGRRGRAQRRLLGDGGALRVGGYAGAREVSP